MWLKDTEALVCDLQMPKVNAKVISWQICFLVTVDRDWVDVVSVGIGKYTTGTCLHH